MKTLLLIWSLVIGHCLAGPFFLGQQGVVSQQSSSAGFNPDDYISSRVWLAARRETAYSDGASVETPNNYSPAGITVTQATSSKRPTYKTAVLGGQNAFRFDGVDDTLQAASTTINQANGITLIMVSKCLNGAKPAFIEQGSNASSSPGFYVYGTTASTAQKYAGAGYQYVNATSSSWLSTDTAVVVVAWRSDGSFSIWKNGTAVALNATGTVGSYSAGSVSDVINIMSRNGASLLSNADLAELVIGEGEVDSTDVADIQTKLGGIYGL